MVHKRNLNRNLKVCEFNETENTICQNLWDASKAVLRGKFIEYIYQKEERSKIKNLSFHLRKLGKEE